MFYDELLEQSEEFNHVSKIQNKELNRVKNLDKGYVSLYRQKTNLTGKKVNITIDCYISGDVGSSIRNAVTGEYYKYKVGTKDEDKLFKITIATGELRNKNGNTLLFYDSPEQCESHLIHSLSDEIKEKWKMKLFK